MSRTRVTSTTSKNDALDRRDPFARQVRQNVEAVLKGRLRLDEMVGATSIRGAVGLILGRLEEATTLGKDDIWAYLDPANRLLVLALQEHYRNRAVVWRRLHESLS